MKNNVIIALDFNNSKSCSQFLQKFTHLEEKPFIKIGMELFYSCGIEYVKLLKHQGYQIFLDVKIFDIPQTVYNTIFAIVSQVEVDIINIHALGLKEMMQQAKQAIIDANVKTKLIAVTLLTSIDERQLRSELKVNNSFQQMWENLVQLCVECKMDGIVCSSQDLAYKPKLPQNFMFVTPGIRTKSDEINDQNRIVTPQMAAKLNATYIVVGRPITKSSNPCYKYQQILQEFNKFK